MRRQVYQVEWGLAAGRRWVIWAVAAPVSEVVQPSSSWMVGWPAITTAHVYSPTCTWSMPTATTQSAQAGDTLNPEPVLAVLTVVLTVLAVLAVLAVCLRCLRCACGVLAV